MEASKYLKLLQYSQNSFRMSAYFNTNTWVWTNLYFYVYETFPYIVTSFAIQLFPDLGELAA